MNDAAIRQATALIESFEGFRAEPYRDVAGLWTIGFGNRYLLDGSRVTPDTPPISRVDGETLLRAKVAATATAVESAVAPTVLSDCQAAACISLAYNIGTGGFRGSTLAAFLRAGRFADAAGQFARWNKSGGKVCADLTRRRETECKVFNGETNT